MRTTASSNGSWRIDVTDLQTGELVGQLTYLQADLIGADSTLSSWNHQLAISMTGGWGAGLGTSVSGTGSCAGTCNVAPGGIDFPKQPVTLTSAPFGYVLVNSTVSSPGSTGRARTTVTPNPSWTVPLAPISSTPVMDVRCDNAEPSLTFVGCVFPDYVPVNIVSRTGLYPNYAHHLSDAQTSGLAGAYPPSGTPPEAQRPLHRTVDPDAKDKHRDTACPQAGKGGYPRPAGYSCDEYPFASTEEGASGLVRGRSFSWCQIASLPKNLHGPTGWSARMIPATENTAAGRDDLNGFYKSNRVIHEPGKERGDAFFVWIVA